MCRCQLWLILMSLPLILFLAAPAWADGPSEFDQDYYSTPAPKKKTPAAKKAPTAAPKAKTAAPAPPPGPPRELFRKGWYQAAYDAFRPQVAAGNPEAAFYTLVIRRNGLDGRAPAGPGELSSLWGILNTNADFMRQALRDRQAPEATRHAYRTALAHLTYFGSVAPAWPPAPVRDSEAKSRARAALRELAAATGDFTPALDFAAFLNYDPTENSQRTVFNHTRQAAEAGDFLAMGNLAWLYREGLGTEKNNLRSVHWARRGCDSHPPVARNANEVGAAYETGRGVTPDPAEAANWYGQSAAQGHPAGQDNASRLKNKAAGAPRMDNVILF